MNSKSKKSKLDPASFVVVANRLPVDRVEQEDGTADWRPSPGGLVTAFEPVMRRRQGAWVGWHGAADEELEPFEHEGLTLAPVPLSSSEVEDYYEGFSNATLWPLYHDVIAPPQFRREWWDTYVIVNQRFADQVAEVAAEGAVVWVQDYHLQLVPQMLRLLRPDLRIGFFLHIPFPPTELYVQASVATRSWRACSARIWSDFNSPVARENFVRLVRQRLELETHRDRIRTRTAARCSPGPIRSRSMPKVSTSWPPAPRPSSGLRRSVATSATRGCCSSASTVSITRRGYWNAFTPSAS